MKSCLRVFVTEEEEGSRFSDLFHKEWGSVFVSVDDVGSCVGNLFCRAVDGLGESYKSNKSSVNPAG